MSLGSRLNTILETNYRPDQQLPINNEILLAFLPVEKVKIVVSIKKLVGGQS